MAINSITIIGSGNLAWHLVNACTAADIKIDHIAGKNIEHAKSLADEINCDSYSDLHSVFPLSELYILAVKDEAIAETAKLIYREGMKIIHTSGSTSSTVLNFEKNDYGVLWPMQTLVKGNNINYSEMLVCLTASDEKFREELYEFASKISGRVEVVSDEQRSILHLSAVWVNNFTNHMFDIANTILNEHHLKFELMMPMIRDMMQKAGTADPSELQTGPAKRDDKITLENHLKLMEKYPEWKELYQRLSDSIRNQLIKQ